MAKVIDALPARDNGRKGKSKYPWATWFDGQVWQLESGTDFTAKRDALRQQAYRAAKNRGLVLQIRKVGEKDIALQAQPAPVVEAVESVGPVEVVSVEEIPPVAAKDEAEAKPTRTRRRK